MRYPTLLLLFGFIVMTTIGCGDRGGIPVTGTVTQDGQPLESARVDFVPKRGTMSPSASARIEGGRFSIGASEGLQPGHFVVRVTFTKPPPDRVDAESVRQWAKSPKPFETDHQLSHTHSQIALEIPY